MAGRLPPAQEHPEEPGVPAEAAPDAGLGRAGRPAGQGVRGAQRPRQPQAQEQPAAAPLHCDVTDAREGRAEGAEEARPPGERVLLVAGAGRLQLLLQLEQQQVADVQERQGGEDAPQLGPAADTQLGEAPGALQRQPEPKAQLGLLRLVDSVLGRLVQLVPVRCEQPAAAGQHFESVPGAAVETGLDAHTAREPATLDAIAAPGNAVAGKRAASEGPRENTDAAAALEKRAVDVRGRGADELLPAGRQLLQPAPVLAAGLQLQLQPPPRVPVSKLQLPAAAEPVPGRQPSVFNANLHGRFEPAADLSLAARK